MLTGTETSPKEIVAVAIERAGMGKREEGRGARGEGRGKREAGRGKGEGGRGKREAGSGKRKSGFGRIDYFYFLFIVGTSQKYLMLVTSGCPTFMQDTCGRKW